jgi:hypothetical protein
MNDKQILSQYLPEKAVDQVHRWIIEHSIHFRITRSRQTKLGDYRPPIRHSNHRISVNHDLNKYAFLITFVHELAHLKVFEKHGTKVRPHGQEWKGEYRSLMGLFIGKGIFPDELDTLVAASVKKSKASSVSDIQLTRALSKYNSGSSDTHLEELELGTHFQTSNGRAFQKGEKVRTRIKCLNLQNKKTYLFHPLTPVMPV